MKEKWMYVAMLVMVSISCYQQLSIINGLLLCGLVIRIAIEQDKQLVIISILVISVVIFQLKRVDEEQRQQLLLVGQQQQVQLIVDVNKLKVNGDLLTARAEVRTDTQKFPTTIRYQIKSDKEKQRLARLTNDCIWQGQVEFVEIDGQRNLKSFDYAQYLKSQRIFIGTKIKKLGKCYQRQGYRAKIHQLRYQLVDKIKNDQNGTITEYALALIFAEKQQLSPDDVEMFKELGIMHLLAISGLHIMIFAQLLEQGLWRMGITREVSQWLVLVIMLVYGCLIQWNISGTRAIGIVVLQIICGKLFHKNLSTIDALSIVAIVNCLVNPYIMNSSAFQLSYGMCVFVILVDRLPKDMFQEPFGKTKKGARVLQELFCIAAICLLGIPLIAKYFYSYHLLSALVGIVMTIILAKWLIPSLLCYVILVSLNAKILVRLVAFIFNKSFALIVCCLQTISQLKIFKLTLGAGNLSLWVIYYLLIIVYLLEMSKPSRLRRKPIVIGAIISIVAVLLAIPYQFEQKVVYLDVGQGDSSLIIDRGYNNVVLIDTGGQLKIPKKDWQICQATSHAQKTVIPALQALGISRIKTVILTHADTDHIGNLVELNQNFTIDRVVMSKGMEKNAKMIQLIEQCPQLNWQLIEAPAQYKQGDIMMQIVSPLNESTGDNHDSLVTAVNFAGVDWLFLGDIDQEKELELLKTYPQLTTTILKLAHHGSDTSSHNRFLQEIDSQYAIISCGKHNIYRHPSKKVLKRLEEVNLSYARTDKEGAIEVIPKKDRIIVHKVLTNEHLIIVP